MMIQDRIIIDKVRSKKLDESSGTKIGVCK